MSWFGATRGRRGFDVLKGLIANDPSERVRERAISTLGNSREPEALDLLIATGAQGSELAHAHAGDLGAEPPFRHEGAGYASRTRSRAIPMCR